MPPKPTQTPAQEPKQKSLDIFDVNTNLDQVKLFFSKLSDDQKQIELNKIKRKIEKLVEQANKEEGNGQSTQKLIALNKQGTVLFLTEVVKNLPKRVVEITPPNPISKTNQ